MANDSPESVSELTPPIPQVGERWAYRARANDPLVEVEVVRTGAKRPARLLVRFVDDDFEGLRDWVPPARLKVAWGQVEAYRAREARWDRVCATAPARDSTEERAVADIFSAVIGDGLASLDYRSDGVARIRDLDGLAAWLEVNPDVLRSDDASFEEDGDLIVPWATSLYIAKRAAELHPEPILEGVDREEAKARREAVHGWYTGGRNGHWVEPEWCIRWDEEHHRPVRAMLRDWCRAEAVGLRDELASLRDEVRRLTGVVELAIDELGRAKAARAAQKVTSALSNSTFDPQASSRPSSRLERRRAGTS